LRWPRDTPLSAKVGTSFADRRRPLCRPKPYRAVAPLDLFYVKFLLSQQQQNNNNNNNYNNNNNKSFSVSYLVPSSMQQNFQ
jgi:hypothetical protein